MKSIVAHVRALWPRWPLLPPLPFYAIVLFDLARHEVRWEHGALIVVVTVLAYGNAWTKKLCIGFYPFGLVAIVYDAMRLVKNVGLNAHTVHVCDLRNAELSLFGVTSGGVKITPQDWFQAHTTTWLDVLCSIPYGTFIFVCMGFAAWCYFKDFAAMQRFTWMFLLLNVMGFVTYHVYPAAPPWYFHTHGCVVDLTAHSSEGPNLARVDALLGFSYFHGMYGRASDVFGAVPSLHVAYPFVVVLEGWRLFSRPARAGIVSFWALMCFSAIYLDHHWVIDVLVGLSYAILAFVFTRWVSVRLARFTASRASRAADFAGSPEAVAER